jgi:hypothetical protein
LIQHPQGFAIIGIQFKQVPQLLLWDLGRPQVDWIEGAEQSQQSVIVKLVVATRSEAGLRVGATLDSN